MRNLPKAVYALVDQETGDTIGFSDTKEGLGANEDEIVVRYVLPETISRELDPRTPARELRDDFAIAALAGLGVFAAALSGTWDDDVAVKAYAIADVMLAKRAKKK